MHNNIHALIHREWFPGLILLLVTLAALLTANSSLAEAYHSSLDTKLRIQLGEATLAKPLILWINDGLMAFFFLLIGLELKRELLFGHLRSVRAVMLPLLGAVGGMAAPALVYLLINQGDPVAARGWAIPAATDIAFALAALAVLGSRIPSSLKVFLLALAIFDDIGAIIIIALFYTGGLSMEMAAVAGGFVALLLVMNRIGIRSLAPYLFVGALLWFAVLKSGVHATLAGVVLAFFIPSSQREGERKTPALTLEHGLHGFCMFLVLPLFAFANAGLAFRGNSLIESLTHPVPLGITLGLTVGKLIGILLCVGLGVRLFRLRLPTGSNWLHIAGVACLCGIGFTMSLFIGSLAFEEGGPAYDFDERLGILLGSTLSAVVGLAILFFGGRPAAAGETK